MIRRRIALSISAALVSSLVLAACGSSDEKGSEKPESQPTQGGTELAAVWPLTGLPATGKTPDHPVMVVKIDNTAASDPQIGLGRADMVVEELVEGGITRLAALFYSRLPGKVGPVRSARASDIGVVKPTHAVLIASGMAPPTKGRLNAAGVTYFEMGAPGVERHNDPQHDSLHSVFADLPKLARSIKKQPLVPASYLPWGSEEDFTGVVPANRLTAKFTVNGSGTQFRYDPAAKKYDNLNTYAADGDHFRPDSVLVLRVREGDAGYLDPAGNHVPETLFFGQGNLVLFHNGQAIRGTWKKDKRESTLELSTAAGPLKVPAGHVWIELLPRDVDGGRLTFGK